MTEMEEEEEAAPRGRPNAYFADKDRTGYDGAYRAVPSVHGGQATVRPEETKGDFEHCWCGQQVDHDWPGKAGGAPHPKRGTDMHEKVSRNHLRGYHSTLQEFVIKAVNDYGLRVRFKANSLLLYPPDGSDPRSVYKRNTDRQLAGLGDWWRKHCAPSFKEEEVKEVTPEAVAKLAEKVNSPEHPVVVKVEETAIPEVKKKFIPPLDRDVAKAIEDGARAADEYERARQIEDGEWYRHVLVTGELSDYILTDGTNFKCAVCGEVRDSSRGVSGHHQHIHGGAKARTHTPEARAKAEETKRRRRAENRLREAFETLAEAAGVTIEGDDKLAAEVEKLRAENEKLRKERDEAKTRLALIRESLTA